MHEIFRSYTGLRLDYSSFSQAAIVRTPQKSKSQYRFDKIADLLTRQAELRGTACALETPSGAQLSYTDLHRRVNNISAQLRAFGFGRSSRVVIVLPNGLNMAIMLLAVSSTAIAAPLNPSYREAEFEYYIKEIGANCVVVPADGGGSLARIVARRIGIPVLELNSDGSSLVAHSEIAGVAGGAERSAPTGDDLAPTTDDIALILLTSGSTGRSKRVPLTHRNLCASVADICFSLELDERDVCLSMWEQFHIGGLVDLLLVPLASGGRIICTSGFDAEQFFTILDTRSPTWFQAVPTTSHEILAVARKTERASRKTSLRFIRSVASALSLQLMERLESFFQVPVVQTFGMTEAGPLITTNPLPPGVRKPGSTGPSCGPMLSIRDAEGRELPPGQTGEILVRGENVVAGYEGNAEANAHSFRDGWFRTGDTGYLDKDGYLFLKGRIKEEINRGGEKIIPQEIDDVLAAHPEIEQAASFSVKHATLGEDVGVAVVVRENSSLDADAVRRIVAGQLSEFKVPKTILFLPSLPRSTIGKIKRDTLAAIAESDSAIAPYAPPNTKLQEILCKVWAEELGKTNVGLDDDFFRLGGDSLSAVRLALAIETLFEIKLDPAALAKTLTIRQLASLIESLPDYDKVYKRIRKGLQTAVFDESRIQGLLANIAAGRTGSAAATPDTAKGMKHALLKCDSGHAFDVLLEAYFSELTPNEWASLADISLTSAESRSEAGSKFFSLQRMIRQTIVPWASQRAWRRQSLANSVRHYTSPEVSVSEKTLIVGFARNLFRFMMPMWIFLSLFGSGKFDLLFLWDPYRKHYCEGVAGLGENFHDLAMSVQAIISHLGYRRTIGFGTSAGALPAVCAGIVNRWDSIVGVGADNPQLEKRLLHPMHFIPKLARPGSDEVLAKKQRIRLYYSQLHEGDSRNAREVAKLTKGEAIALIGYKSHTSLWEAREKGDLPRLFLEFFDEIDPQ